MISLLENIRIDEAQKTPSGIKKYKNTSKEKTVHFLASDIYDTSDPGYDEKVKYYSAEGNGYIMDKEGKIYDVQCGSFSSDAGRIVGGTINKVCNIRKVLGKYDLYFSGYHGIFSKASSDTYDTIESDIADGMYLEDYIAKHWKDLDYQIRNSNKEIEQLKAKGDPNAKTTAQNKFDKKELRKQQFYARYVKLPNFLRFKITSDGVDIAYKEMFATDDINKNIEELQNELKNKFGNVIERFDTPEYKEMRNKIEKMLQDNLNNIFGDFIDNFLNSMFKTTNISSYEGINGSIKFDNKSYHEVVAIDSKTHKLVYVDTDKNKVIEGTPIPMMGNVIEVWLNKCSNKVKELFTRASKAFMKLNSKKRTEYVNNNYLTIWKNSGGWQYAEPSITKGEAKEQAKRDFEKMLDQHDVTKNNYLKFTWEMLADYIEGDMPDKPEDTSDEQIIKKPTGPEKVMSKKAQQEANEKMDAWHNGTRKQNLKNCSDAKLKMNYKICKDKGYDKEMKQIEDEASKRGIVLESFSFKDFLELKQI